MNKTEARYALYLEGLRRQGIVDQYWYEGIKLKLADNTQYIPDFMVMMAESNVLEIHEIKGATKNKVTGKTVPWVEDHALIKIKVAADKYPFKFKLAWETKQGWETREY